MKIYPLVFSIFLALIPTTLSDKSKAKSIITDTKKSVEYNFEGDKKIYFYDDHKGAIKDYTESLKFNPRNTYSLFNRANSNYFIYLKRRESRSSCISKNNKQF